MNYIRYFTGLFHVKSMLFKKNASLKWSYKMKNIWLFTVFFISIIFGSSALAGPFGLDMGMALKQIDTKAKKIAPGKYQLTKVPKPHSAFGMYVAQVAPKTGLCFIKALGKEIITNSHGLQLKTAFDNMESKLDKTYGNGKTTDLLISGSIWKDPDDWTMAIRKKERYLIKIWDKDSGATLKNNIKSVALAVGTTSSDRGYISIDYTFLNEEDCGSEIASMEDDAL